MRSFVISSLVSMALAGAAQAATVNEADFGPNGFNVANGAPITYTDIVRNVDTVNGSVSNNQFDMLRFGNLDAGAQTISLTFDIVIPAGNSNFINGGGQVTSKETPGNFAYDGTFRGNYQVSAGPFEPAANNTTTLSFNLDASFAGGPLFVHILPNFGGPVNYSMSLTGNGSGPIAPVPVPAAGLLLLSALGLLAFRRRSLHPRVPQAT